VCGGGGATGQTVDVKCLCNLLTSEVTVFQESDRFIAMNSSVNPFNVGFDGFVHAFTYIMQPNIYYNKLGNVAMAFMLLLPGFYILQMKQPTGRTLLVAW
jgi:hypothetical protein